MVSRFSWKCDFDFWEERKIRNFVTVLRIKPSYGTTEHKGSAIWCIEFHDGAFILFFSASTTFRRFICFAIDLKGIVVRWQGESSTHLSEHGSISDPEVG